MSTIKHLSLSSVPCPICTKETKYLPGTLKVKCEHCGTKSDIPSPIQKSVDELDYFTFLENASNQTEKIDLQTVKCNHCNAVSTVDTNGETNYCHNCGDELLVSRAKTATSIKPWGLIPFRIDEEEAKKKLSKWLKKHWFKPGALTRDQNSLTHLKAVYMPYWTFDTYAVIQYYGKYGEEYHDGDHVRMYWYEKLNELTYFFDDILICASDSVNESTMNALRPWGTEDLIPFDENYLAGYTAEIHQIDLKNGFDKAQDRITEAIEVIIRKDLGGDDQQILSAKTNYSDITFKHILLPVYIASYRVKDKTHRFVINAKTGKTQGKVPRDWSKVVAFALTTLTITLIAILLLN